MTEQALVQESIVERKKEPPGKAARSPQGWPGTRAEFSALVDTFQDQLLGYAVRRLGRFQDAEDVVQDVFVRGYARTGHGTGVKNVAGYLYRMTANACTDLLRKRKHAGVPLDATQTERIPDQRKNAVEEAEALEEMRRIDAMLRLLPRRQAEVIWLRVFNELRFAEIAAVLGCSEATAKSRFRYGLKKLRPLVERDREIEP